MTAGSCSVAISHVDGQSHTATFAVLANAPAYGGGLRIAPHASLDSDCLDLCLFAWTDRHRFVRHLPASRGGTLASQSQAASAHPRRVLRHDAGQGAGAAERLEGCREGHRPERH
jgi:diacylglycerol kinase family enzyme